MIKLQVKANLLLLPDSRTLIGKLALRVLKNQPTAYFIQTFNPNNVSYHFPTFFLFNEPLLATVFLVLFRLFKYKCLVFCLLIGENWLNLIFLICIKTEKIRWALSLSVVHHG